MATQARRSSTTLSAVVPTRTGLSKATFCRRRWKNAAQTGTRKRPPTLSFFSAHGGWPHPHGRPVPNATSPRRGRSPNAHLECPDTTSHRDVAQRVSRLATVSRPLQRAGRSSPAAVTAAVWRVGSSRRRDQRIARRGRQAGGGVPPNVPPPTAVRRCRRRGRTTAQAARMTPTAAPRAGRPITAAPRAANASAVGRRVGRRRI